MTTPKPDNADALRDPRVDAAWRAASREEPSAALDAAILAAARRGVGARPRSAGDEATTSSRHRWWPLAAAATVAVIAVGIVQRANHEDLGAPGGSAIVSDAPVQLVKQASEPARSDTETAKPAPREASATEAASPAPREASAPSSAGAAAEARRRSDQATPKSGPTGVPPAPAMDAIRRSTPDIAAPAPIRQETGQATAVVVPEPFPAGSPKRDVNGQVGAAPAAPPSVAAGIGAGAPAPPQSPTAKTAGALAEAPRNEAQAPGTGRALMPVADWIALIRRLRAEGHTAEAARELAAFRAAHTDHELLLPQDLRDWRPVEK